MTIIASIHIFCFTELLGPQWGSNFDDSEARSRTSLFLECSNVGNQRFNLVSAQLAAEGLHRRFAVLLNAVFNRRGSLRIGERCLLLRIR